jgi:hypothetical protein
MRRHAPHLDLEEDHVKPCAGASVGGTRMDCIGVLNRTQVARLLLLVGRALLSIHFLAELYDKLAHFSYWVAVLEAADQPFPVAEMMLIIALLLYGAPLLLLGKHVQRAVMALVIFQVPTTLLFESSGYTRLDSVSVIGGLLLAAAIECDHQTRLIALDC